MSKNDIKATSCEAYPGPDCSPFDVPPFSPPPPDSITYIWWSWHPRYPKWSKSCFRAPTVEEAQRYLEDPRYKLDYYHNKLICHGGETLVEVQDVPCKRMDVWREIKLQMDKENPAHLARTTPEDRT